MTCTFEDLLKRSWESWECLSARAAPYAGPFFTRTPAQREGLLTDLDSTLIAKGFLLGLVAIDATPETRRVRGERDDIVHLIHLMIQDPAERERLAAEVERQTSVLVDLTDHKARNWRL